jgi:hypothetical protein
LQEHRRPPPCVVSSLRTVPALYLGLGEFATLFSISLC